MSGLLQHAQKIRKRAVSLSLQWDFFLLPIISKGKERKAQIKQYLTTFISYKVGQMFHGFSLCFFYIPESLHEFYVKKRKSFFIIWNKTQKSLKLYLFLCKKQIHINGNNATCDCWKGSPFSLMHQSLNVPVCYVMFHLSDLCISHTFWGTVRVLNQGRARGFKSLLWLFTLRQPHPCS